MSTLRYIVTGIILAGLLAGWGSMSENGLHPVLGGTLLIVGVVYVGIRMIGGISAHSSDELQSDNKTQDRPAFKVLEKGFDPTGRPYFIIRGTSDDASRFIRGWTYPGSVSWIHTHIGNYKWKIHVEDWDM